MDDLIQEVNDSALALYNAKQENLGDELMRELERVMMLRVVDEYWMDHIDAMEELKKGIQLRAYAQTDPVDAYKKEGFEMFEGMIEAIQQETIRRILVARVQTNEVQPRARGQGHRPVRRQRGRCFLRQEAAGPQDHQGRPQRSLPLRQRQEV